MTQDRVQINLHYGILSEHISIRGTIFNGFRRLSLTEFIEHISAVPIDDIASYLATINGFFSIVAFNGRSGWMAVDRLRTFPLFYGIWKDTLFISDDARWVQEKVESWETDSIACAEFYLTGYVTGPDTLFPRVKQVQAGELLRFHITDEGRIYLNSERYFRFIHHDYYREQEPELLKKLDDVLVNVFHRFLKHANGRLVVIPLSGGYDSRLIALMLKRLGYQNQVAFSYGRPNNQEAIISKNIAEQLNIRWLFVPYTKKRWYQWYRSSEMRSYFKYADGLCSLPNIQDWPAVWALSQEYQIPKDAIFVPGHSGDKVSGSLSKLYPIFYQSEVAETTLISAIINIHYNLWPSETNQQRLLSIRERIFRTLGSLDQYPDGASALESWDITERQPKFILNSLRTYEFWGYEWWVPLWDCEFIDYWRRIPPIFRLNQQLYLSYVKKLTDDLGIKNVEKTYLPSRYKQHLRLIAHKFLPEDLKNYLLNIYRTKKAFEHPLAWYGIHKTQLTLHFIKLGASSINSILVADYISNICRSHFKPFIR